jgi:N,N'-diacetyllegionaminate synthase
MILNSNIKKTYIIAEAGVNHNGKYEIAKKLIKSAALCKANAIKFQIFSASDLATPKAKMAKYQKKNIKKKLSQQDMLKKLELKKNDYLNLKKYAKKNNIDFMVSVFDEKSLDFYEKKIKNKLLKIPSGEITNYFLLRKLDYIKYKIILSTGMSNLEEIMDALNIIAKSKIYDLKKNKIRIRDKKKHFSFKKKVFLLHCVSDYPVSKKFLNLNCINTLIKNFQLITGFSDHSTSLFTSSISVAAGAKIIEKHFTLNKKMLGPDHSSSLNPIQLKKFIQNIRETELILGSDEKKVQPCEVSNMKSVRKSIVALDTINKNEKFSMKKLTAKRPANGLSPINVFKILKKKAKKKFTKNEIIK